MTWIAEAALGALIGELLMGRRLGNWALAWGALFGILPNAEVLISPFLSTVANLSWLGGISHSLGMLALVSFGLGSGLCKLWQKQKIDRFTAGRFVAAAWAGHVLLDCLTVRGAGIFWPVSSRPVAFGILDSKDFLFPLPFLTAAIWILWVRQPVPKKTRSKKLQRQPMPRRQRLVLWALSLSSAYLGLGATMKSLTTREIEMDLKRRGIAYTRHQMGPTPSNCLLWRSVVDCENDLWVGYRSVFDASNHPTRWTIYPKGNSVLAHFRQAPEITALERFTDSWCIARPNVKGVCLGDLRLPESRTWGEKKFMVDSRLATTWVFNQASDRDPVRQIETHSHEDTDYFKRMIARIFRNREIWEATPRLAGIEGRLPEILPVSE